MNDLKIFENEEFGAVRTAEIDGRVCFCGSDIARALGYVRTRDAISQHCKGAVKYRTPTSGGEQELSFIPEGDVYRLIVKSKLPAAEKFERWVFDEVLPNVREHGAYLTPEVAKKTLLDPEFLMELAGKMRRLEGENKALTETVYA